MRCCVDLIAAHNDDLLRLAGSLKFGHATASLLVGKLSASGRQNQLAAALAAENDLRGPLSVRPGVSAQDLLAGPRCRAASGRCQ
nr:Tn3 family transposase [Saccharopolyspora sp. ASAGF58]